MEKINEIYSTMDYDMFVEMEGNRNISLGHLNKITESINKKFIPMPIIVTPSKDHEGKYEVFEGQHRFQSLKAMGKPIVFTIIEDLTIHDAILINTVAKKWAAEDYLSHYIALGNQNYIELKRFMDLTGLPLSLARIFFELKSCKGFNQREAFNTGRFVMESFEASYELYLKHLDYGSCESFNKNIFKLAIIKCLIHNDYNHERMKTKLAQVGYKIGHRASISDYLEAVTEVYNYNAGKENRIFFYID